MIAIYVSHLKKKSRSGDRSYNSSCKEIAMMKYVAIGRSLLQQQRNMSRSGDRSYNRVFIPFQICIANMGNLWVAQRVLFSQDFRSNTVQFYLRMRHGGYRVHSSLACHRDPFLASFALMCLAVNFFKDWISVGNVCLF